MDPVVYIKKRIIQGTTPRVLFQILDDQSPREGFKPTTLAMSIYNIKASESVHTIPPTADSSYVNGRSNVDVIADCDASGNVDVTLETDDTDLTAAQVSKCTAKGILRRVLFQWTWNGGARHGAAICDLLILPTYKPT